MPGRGRTPFTVTDEAQFSENADFEGAVITLGDIKELGNNRYLITWNAQEIEVADKRATVNPSKLRFEWETKSLMLEVKSNVPYKFSIDTINEDTYHKLPVYRMAFTAAEKAKDIKMEFIYTPVVK